MAAYEVVTVEGLAALLKMQQLPAAIETAAYRAINKATERARTDAANRMRKQVAFSASYLAPGGGRLVVDKQASRGRLEAAITGRDRPTSLARFATSTSQKSHAGVLVQVAPGKVLSLPKAFFVKLRRGAANTETQHNLGLAIRLPAGKKPRRVLRGGAKEVAPGLWLLYGPSVGQVFNLTRNDVAPAALDFLEAEFNRLLEF